MPPPCHDHPEHKMMMGGGSPGASHGSGHDHAAGGMVMTFEYGTRVPVLFDGLVAGPDVMSYVFGLLCVFLLAVLRQELVRLSEVNDQPTTGVFANVAPVTRKTIFFGIQATLSYLLMLIAMTFNLGMFLAVIMGLTVGFYRSLAADGLKAKSECCS